MTMLQDARTLKGLRPRSWHALDCESLSTRGGVQDETKVFVSVSRRCQQLYMEAVDRGIQINGKICSAVMLGFGSDLSVRIALGPVSC